MNEIQVILFIFVNILARVTSEDVLGCGGFVKSHIPIDFSRVEVKLLTKQGILKDKINCAPTNGYYFVPLYDKGEYILELEPPPGWSFTPTKVNLVVDGVSDLCSKGQDIDFVFKGFGITGKVESLGAQGGPEGVEVELYSENQETRKTTTGTNGNFFFTPVFPGKYKLSIVNSKWKTVSGEVSVVVKEENMELKPNSLVIQGYDVTGFVKNEGNPIKDAVVVLYSLGKANIKVAGCDKTPLPGVKNALCFVKSDENGVFRFETVPSGKYYVAPHYSEQNIYYQPNKIDFTVEHNSVTLQENFEIVGFSVSGKVLKSPNSPIANAKIYLNGKEVAKTSSNGVYTLEKLKAGSYNLKASVDGFQFNEVVVKLNPNIKEIPSLTPSAYKYCGKVISDKSQTVTFSKMGSTTFFSVLSDLASGQFCEFLGSGKYQVQVNVESSDLQKGLQFFPQSLTLEVNGEQKEPIIFSQLKATISGKVQCIQKKDCDGLQVVLRAKSAINDKSDIVLPLINGIYKVSEINPGMYDISLTKTKLCWKQQSQSININSVNVEVPPFVQSGYSVTFVPSHATEVAFKYPGQNSENTIKLNAEPLNYCLSKPGTYTFHLRSCHSYESDFVAYSTDSEQNEIFLNAQKHTLTLKIESDKKHGDVTAVVNIDGVKRTTAPLPFKENGYELKLLLSPSETAVIVPQSDILFFNPPILSISGSKDCKDHGVKFTAVLGVVFKGKVIPPLSGVLVTVETDNSEALMTETDQNGVYKFRPLDQTKNYKIVAKKDSYVLVGPNSDGNFLAHKLAEIGIEVIDGADNSPLQGSLLSLSGGDSYRSNLQTNAQGKITFHSLSPGEYFLRPMMKEYNFEPNSKIIKVNEGQTVNVQLIGKRVAYSAYGQVTSLNGEPEENIVVVALGVGNCSHFSEESTSESNGQFRIRGLQPHCSYDITVKNGGKEKYPIERSAPRTIHVEKVTQDITGLQLVIFRAVANTDLLVKVYAKNVDHYKSLRLKVIRELPTSSIVYNGRVDTSSLSLANDNNQGILVQIPPLPLDGKTYSVHLESNLNNKLEPEPEILVANTSFKYVELNFVVKSNVTEQDIKQTSVWTLVFIFSLIFVVINIDKVSQFLRERFGGYVSDLLLTATKKPAANDYPVDNDDIDQIVQSINAVKRKPKAKKL